MATNYGRELSCTTSLKTGRYVSGPRLVAESDYRRLTTPRGMLLGDEDEANFGLDLTEIIGSVATANDAASLPGRIRVELMKDERHESVDVTVLETKEGPTRRLQIAIEAVTSEGPFTLTIAASAVSVELLGIKTGDA